MRCWVGLGYYHMGRFLLEVSCARNGLRMNDWTFYWNVDACLATLAAVLVYNFATSQITVCIFFFFKWFCSYMSQLLMDDLCNMILVT